MMSSLKFIFVLFCYGMAWCANGFCIFGSGKDCFFPCRCSALNNSPCNAYTGSCSRGCKQGKPQYYDWQGPGCQIGNLAYQKPTLSNTVINKTSNSYNRPQMWCDTNKTTDGILKLRVFDGSCTVVYTDKKTVLPWLMVDLQMKYMVTKVILINTDNSVDASYLEDFDVKVGDDTNMENQQLCKRWTTKVGTGRRVTIVCPSPIPGRYVSIKKYSERNKVGRLPLCEFVVMGHKYIEVNWDKCKKRSTKNIWCEECDGMIPPDCKKPCPANSYGQYCQEMCGHCKDNEECDKMDGSCEVCEMGWKPPRCDEPCPNNTYGYGCQYQCGKCKDNSQCDLNTGACVGQCELWYANEDPLCDTFIPMVNADSQPTVMFTKSTWALLSIRLDYPYTLAQYYQFKLYYLHENDPLSQYKDYINFTMHYNNGTHEVQIHIEGLEPATQYWFAIQVFRSDRNHSEGGITSSSIKLTTQSDDNGSDENNNKNNKGSTLKPTPSNKPRGDIPSQIKHNQPTNIPNVAVKVGYSKSRSENHGILPPHHVNILTVTLNLVIFGILIAIGIGVGVYFYKKRQARMQPPLNSMHRDPVNMVYSSQVNIIDQTDDLYSTTPQE